MLKRPVLKPTKIHNGADASSSGERDKSRDASPASNPVINDMIHKLSERMNSAQVEVHLLVNDMDDEEGGGSGVKESGGEVVVNGGEKFTTPGKREKGVRRPPISNIDSVSLPSSRSSSISSTHAPTDTHHHNHNNNQHHQHNNVDHHHHQQQQLANYSLPLSSSAETVIPASTSASDAAVYSNQQPHQRHAQPLQPHHGPQHEPPSSVLQPQPIPAYQPRSGTNVETVYKNYEMLVTRLCSLESTIQSLKLKLASKEVMRECKECFKKSEKLNHLNDAYEKDLHELRGQVVQAKGEVQNERVLRQSAEIRVKHAESMLDSNTNDKAELSEKLSSMNEVGG